MKRLRAGIQIIIKVTITLASGKKQVISITVQKTTVRTIKITGLKSSVTVARNKKLTLKPVISPITSQEKVTYSSSNKKIVTVNSKGVITGKKKETAYITVKSGKIRKKVKVVVKKMIQAGAAFHEYTWNGSSCFSFLACSFICRSRLRY